MVKVHEAADFTFQPPPQVSRARRVLIKPDARYPYPHPLTTSRQTLEKVITAIRRVSDADIVLLEGNPEGMPMAPIYQALGYRFPRVATLDVKDSVWVEIESPLAKPFALPSAWVPNVVLSCDFWINVSTFKVIQGQGHFSIHNLLGLLPPTKYRWKDLLGLGIYKVKADLYFTLPFDLAIIDGVQLFVGEREEIGGGTSTDYGKVWVGEPYEVDWEAAQASGASTDYLELIRTAREELEV